MFAIQDVIKDISRTGGKAKGEHREATLGKHSWRQQFPTQKRWEKEHEILKPLGWAKDEEYTGKLWQDTPSNLINYINEKIFQVFPNWFNRQHSASG